MVLSDNGQTFDLVKDIEVNSKSGSQFTEEVIISNFVENIEYDRILELNRLKFSMPLTTRPNITTEFSSTITRSVRPVSAVPFSSTAAERTPTRAAVLPLVKKTWLPYSGRLMKMPVSSLTICRETMYNAFILSLFCKLTNFSAAVTFFCLLRIMECKFKTKIRELFGG